MVLTSNSLSIMGDLGKGGDVRVNSGDAGIESVEKVKLVEEAHAPLLCHRVCDPSAVAGHPVLGYTPVHYCGLADTGALCIPTPGAYQSRWNYHPLVVKS